MHKFLLLALATIVLCGCVVESGYIRGGPTAN
jgi:hypothetical protein